jgi:hypothetical protein
VRMEPKEIEETMVKKQKENQRQTTTKTSQT